MGIGSIGADIPPESCLYKPTNHALPKMKVYYRKRAIIITGLVIFLILKQCCSPMYLKEFSLYHSGPVGYLYKAKRNCRMIHRESIQSQ